MKALRMSAAPAAADDIRHVAGRQHPAAMQHDHRIVGATSSSRWVAHSTATPRSRTSAADVAQDRGA